MIKKIIFFFFSGLGIWFRYSYPGFWLNNIIIDPSWKLNPQNFSFLNHYFELETSVKLVKVALGFFVILSVKTLNQLVLHLFFRFTFKLPFISSFIHLLNRIFGVLVLPHLKAANNIDHPNSEWNELEKQMKEFNSKRLDKKAARDHDAYILSLVITNFITGWTISDFVRDFFLILGLKWNIKKKIIKNLFQKIKKFVLKDS